MEHRVAEFVRERGNARIAGRRGDILERILQVDGASAHVPVAVREDDEDADVVVDAVVGRILVITGGVGVLERLLPPRVVVVADEGGADAPLHDVVLAAVAGEDEGASVRQHGAVEERLARPPRPLRDRADGIDVEAVGERAVRLVGERARPHAPRVGDELLLVVLRVAVAADDDDDVVVVAPRLLDDVDGHVVRLAPARVGIVGAEEHADRRRGLGRRDRQACEEKGEQREAGHPLLLYRANPMTICLFRFTPVTLSQRAVSRQLDLQGRSPRRGQTGSTAPSRGPDARRGSRPCP